MTWNFDDFCRRLQYCKTARLLARAGARMKVWGTTMARSASGGYAFGMDMMEGNCESQSGLSDITPKMPAQFKTILPGGPKIHVKSCYHLYQGTNDTIVTYYMFNKFPQPELRVVRTVFHCVNICVSYGLAKLSK